MEFSYDAAGVEAAAQEASHLAGRILRARTWLNEACSTWRLHHASLIGADIRPNCIDALQLVGKIKNDLVEEKEIYA